VLSAVLVVSLHEVRLHNWLWEVVSWSWRVALVEHAMLVVRLWVVWGVVHNWQVLVALVVNWSWQLDAVEVALIEGWLVVVADVNVMSPLMVDWVHGVVVNSHSVLRQGSQLAMGSWWVVSSNSVNWDIALGIVRVGALLSVMGIMGWHSVAVGIQVVRQEVVLCVLDVQMGNRATRAVLTRHVVVMQITVLVIEVMWASAMDWGLVSEVVVPVVIEVRVVMSASVGVVVNVAVVGSLGEMIGVKSISSHSHMIQSAQVLLVVLNSRMSLFVIQSMASIVELVVHFI